MHRHAVHNAGLGLIEVMRRCADHTRRSKIGAGAAAVEALATKLAGPKTRLKTRTAVETAAATALTETGSARWLDVTITETVEESFRQENRGRPGADTRYR